MQLWSWPLVIGFYPLVFVVSSCSSLIKSQPSLKKCNAVCWSGDLGNRKISAEITFQGVKLRQIMLVRVFLHHASRQKRLHSCRCREKRRRGLWILYVCVCGHARSESWSKRFCRARVPHSENVASAGRILYSSDDSPTFHSEWRESLRVLEKMENGFSGISFTVCWLWALGW